DAGPARLQQIHGVGPHTAAQLLGAAGRLAESARLTAAVPVDVDAPEPRTTALVRALHVLVAAGPQARHAVDAARTLTRTLGPLLEAAAP
ncbi:ATP-dependent helicase, partial [Streptomyces sp. SID5785]|nr:ATP-dependent helicase [Streptomyces sp. SID5785]